MKTKGFYVVTAAMIAMDAVCAMIAIWQTAYLTSVQAVLAAEHPEYLSHSWVLLAQLAILGALGCGQLALARKKGAGPQQVGLSCGVSALMIVLEILTIKTAAQQHYHFGILISDYGMAAPSVTGWLMLLLAAALAAATAAQLLTAFVFALHERDVSGEPA